MAARTSGSIDEAEEFDEADDDEFADADADADADAEEEENGAALCREGLRNADAARQFLLLLSSPKRKAGDELCVLP
jgi:hypothetical protein